MDSGYLIRRGQRQNDGIFRSGHPARVALIRVPKWRPHQPAPRPPSELPRNAGACGPSPTPLRGRGSRAHPRRHTVTAPAGGCRLALGQTGPRGSSPWFLPHKAHLQMHRQLVSHASSLSTSSPWSPERAATKPQRRAHLRPYLPGRCHHLGRESGPPRPEIPSSPLAVQAHLRNPTGITGRQPGPNPTLVLVLLCTWGPTGGLAF